MTLAPNLRKLALTAHIIASVGWLGAIAAFVALAIAGVASREPERVRAAYLALGLVYDWVVVPFGIASALSGLASSLGTDWGLVRHYWVLVKVLMTVPLTLLLLLHTQPVDQLAAAAAAQMLSATEALGLRTQLLGYSIAAILALIVATALSIYKPRGRTPFGQRRPSE
ncbi:hypothetical protein [Phenylobacterium sp.]|uniref:hypothetical protein n=1 Tax=Phenylobacterium sp. TaxID=1871053 RepID=UPI0035642F5D